MRIGMIMSTPLPPKEGIGFYVWNLSQQLCKLGHQVQIVTRGRVKQTSYEIVEGISIWRPPFVPAYPFHVHLHGIWVDKLIHELEPEVDLFHLHSPLVKWPRTRRPTLVTVHTPMKAFAATVPINSPLGWLTRLQAPISYALEQEIFAGTEQLTAVSTCVAAELKAYGIGPKSVCVLGNGVDTDQFTPAEDDSAEPRHEPYALTVARLAPAKGVADLIECARYVVTQFPNFRFLVAGTGPLENELQEKIARWNLGEHVRLLGHISDRDQLVELYRHATAFVHPAHYEGLPTVLLEAMSCGCPVVATAIGGTLDVVEHERNGLLVPPHQPQQMADAIVSLLQRPALAQCFGQTARKTIEQRYSWRQICENYLVEYEALRLGAPV